VLRVHQNGFVVLREQVVLGVAVRAAAVAVGVEYAINVEEEQGTLRAPRPQ
jgi:hypothetical protein